MHIDEFRLRQQQSAAHDISSLVMSCRRKYLLAAHLLELQSPDLAALTAFGVDSGIEAGPLMQPFAVLAEKYVERFFTSQIDLLPETTHPQEEKWASYLFSVLIPTLLSDDEAVRNILRSVGALPSERGRQAAAAALCERFGEMSLPIGPPLRDF